MIAADYVHAGLTLSYQYGQEPQARSNVEQTRAGRAFNDAAIDGCEVSDMR